MRFSYAESMCDPAFYLPLARAAEEAGYDGFVVPDSICYPEVSDSKYPYTPDGDRRFLEDKPFVEPFSVIPAMAAVTEKLLFSTFVVKLPIRDPVLVAKQASSVAVMSQDRFLFGVGSSPWPDDYRILDQPWKRRGKRMDEMLEIIRGLTAGGYYEFHGEFYDIESIKISPVSERGDPSELGLMIDRQSELRREYGRSDMPFEVHVISLDAYSPDGIKRLEELGVTDAIVGFRNAYEKGPDHESLDDKIAALSRFAEGVIAKL